MHNTHPNVMYNTHILCKCNTIWIHNQGHQQVSITSKHVCKVYIMKIQALKFNGISLQITLSASMSNNRLQDLNTYLQVHPRTVTKIPSRPNQNQAKTGQESYIK